jgi:chromosome segregation ATPase
LSIRKHEDWALGEVCEHGALGRACEVCERDTAWAEIERLETLISEARAALKAERDRLRTAHDLWRAEARNLEQEIARLKRDQWERPGATWRDACARMEAELMQLRFDNAALHARIASGTKTWTGT